MTSLSSTEAPKTKPVMDLTELGYRQRLLLELDCISQLATAKAKLDSLYAFNTASSNLAQHIPSYGDFLATTVGEFYQKEVSEAHTSIEQLTASILYLETENNSHNIRHVVTELLQERGKTKEDLKTDLDLVALDVRSLLLYWDFTDEKLKAIFAYFDLKDYPIERYNKLKHAKPVGTQ